MRWKIGTKIVTALAVAVVTFAIVAVCTYKGFQTNTEDNNWGMRTHAVIHALDGVIIDLLNAETGNRGFIITGDDLYLEPYLKGKEDFRKSFVSVRDLTADNPVQQNRLNSIEPLVAARFKILDEGIEIRRTKDLQAALEIIRSGRGKSVMGEIRAAVSQMQVDEQKLLDKRQNESASSVKYLKLLIVLGTLLSIVTLVGGGVVLTRSIAKPIGAITGVAERVAAGDLTVRVESDDRSDEVGALQRALRIMIENLRDMNLELRQGAGVLASSSAEILATVSQVAAGAAETATAVSETSTTAEEVKQTAHLSNQKAKNVQESAQKVAAVSETGRKAVTETLEGMNLIREQMEEIAESVVRLSEQGQTIGEIIATVNDLAEQSNLLAVNAAIEATRAGEFGKGFAVVAQEVKSLAEQSRQATTQVRTILMEVQKATSAAVMATEQGTKAVAAGVKQATEAGESIRVLTGSVGEAAQAAIQIAASSQQQLVGMDQIASAIANIRQATTQNMAGTQQLETSARNLKELGGKLKVLVERQKVEG